MDARKRLPPKELFDRRQVLLKKSSHQQLPKKHQFAYLGVFRCEHCGCAITGQRQKAHLYYHCTRKTAPCHRKACVREEHITRGLQDLLKLAGISDEWAEKMLAQVEIWKREEGNTAADLLEKQNNHLVSVQTKLDKLLDLFLDNGISRDDVTSSPPEKKNSSLKKRRFRKKLKFSSETRRLGKP